MLLFSYSAYSTPQMIPNKPPQQITPSQPPPHSIHSHQQTPPPQQSYVHRSSPTCTMTMNVPQQQQQQPQQQQQTVGVPTGVPYVQTWTTKPQPYVPPPQPTAVSVVPILGLPVYDPNSGPINFNAFPSQQLNGADLPFTGKKITNQRSYTAWPMVCLLVYNQRSTIVPMPRQLNYIRNVHPLLTSNAAMLLYRYSVMQICFQYSFCIL